MKIRSAKLDDYDACSLLFDQVDQLHSNQYPDIFTKNLFKARSKEYISYVINDINQELLLVEENNEILGLAKLDIEQAQSIPLFVERKWINISTIVIDQKHLHKGYGQALLDYIKVFAQKKNINEIELSVFSFNQQAIDFYEKNGFQEIRKKMHLNIGKR